jgi:hypothetical protein
MNALFPNCGSVGKDHREDKSPSWFNPIEVTIVKQYIQALRENQKLRLSTIPLMLDHGKCHV